MTTCQKRHMIAKTNVMILLTHLLRLLALLAVFGIL
jgi:hypothetical protein